MEKNIQMIREIKERGITDPNLDIWLGVLTNDTTLIQNGKNNGGDINISLQNVLKKYI